MRTSSDPEDRDRASRPLDFFVVGAAKSGTTTLFRLLEELIGRPVPWLDLREP